MRMVEVRPAKKGRRPTKTQKAASKQLSAVAESAAAT